MNFIKYLFSKKYFPIDYSKKRENHMPGSFKDPKYSEFKEDLLNLLCTWMAEELAVKGNISAQYEVYLRLVESFTPKERFEEANYKDPIKEIEEQIKKELANRK